MASLFSTPRRSRRGQPIVSSPVKSRVNSESTASWIGCPCFSRQINPNFDLVGEELNAWVDVDEDGREFMISRFYQGFQRAELSSPSRRVKGARKTGTAGLFEIGNTIYVSTMNRLPSIAVITAMWETDFTGVDDVEKMRIRIHWFLRPTELASVRAKRSHRADEIFYQLEDSAVISHHEIIGHCLVVGPKDDDNSEPEGSNSKGTGWTYIAEDKYSCLYATNPRRGLYYDFDWEAHYREAMNAESDGTGIEWNVEVGEEAEALPPHGTPRRKKKGKMEKTEGEDEQDTEDEDDQDSDKYQGSVSSSEDEVNFFSEVSTAHADVEEGASEVEDSEEEKYNSPSRKRKRDKITSPPRKRGRKSVAAPTPHSKRAIAKRKFGTRTPKKLNLRPVATYSGSTRAAIDQLPNDPWIRAMHVLHVGSRPDADGPLKGRENEFRQIFHEVKELIEEGQGGCVYISGVPGTGKTATVHAVIRQLRQQAKLNECSPFTYVEINGLRLPEPSSAYTVLWDAISKKEGQEKPSSKESLRQLSKHFSGGGRRPGGHAWVVLMDELDQLLTGSKQDVVYNFFNWPTLVGSRLIVIAVANTMDLPERALEGRVRSRLGMIRINFAPYTKMQLQNIVNARLEATGSSKEIIIQDAITYAAARVGNISGDARRVLDICRRTIELVSHDKKVAKILDVNDVIKLMQGSPTAAYLNECSFHERVMLAALIKCTKREGVEEVKWGDVQYQHLVYVPLLSMSSVSRRPTHHELMGVLDSLVATRAMLMEDGVAVSRKPVDDRKVVLNLDMGEVQLALADVGGERWKNILN